MKTNATDESPQGEGGLAARVVCVLFGLSLAATLLGLVQQWSGFAVWVEHQVENDKVQWVGDYYRWRLPEPYRTPLVDRTAVLLKDGRPWLNRSVSNKNLREFGAGWFFLVGGGVNFIPPKGIEPRSPEVRLSVATPYQFKPKHFSKVAMGLLVQLLLLQWLRRRAERPLWGRPSSGQGVWEAAKLAAVALAMIWIALGLAARAEFTDHAFVIKGVQESDAGGWYHMAVGLREGRGLTGTFENQRPFYCVLLAGIFAMMGEGLHAVRGLNALALLTAALSAFTVGRLLGSGVLAAALAALLLVGEMHQQYLHAALTENGGLLLAAVSLLGAWQAAWTLSRRWAAAAGLLNGLATLTSGVTILTLPGYAVVVTLFPLWRRTSWRRAMELGVVYSAAASLVIGAWILRQKVVHDRFALSYNTAEVLAGGSDPEEKHLTGRVLQKARDAGYDLSDADSRYDAMMRVFKDNVAADPAGYARQVMQAALESARFLPVDDSAVQTVLALALLLFALGPWLRYGQWHALPLAAGLAMLWQRHEWGVNFWLLLAAAYLMLRRSRRPSERLMVLLLVATVAAVMVLAGLSGNVASKRFWLVADWCALALVLGGARQFLVTGAGLMQFMLRRLGLPRWLAGETAPAPETAAALEPPRLIPAVMTAVLGLSALCGVIVLALTLRGPRPWFAGLDPGSVEVDLAALLAEAQKREPALREVPVSAVATRVVLDSAMSAAFSAGEGTQHWLPYYLVRPYERQVAAWRLADKEGVFGASMAAIIKGGPVELPADWPLLAGGILTTGRHRIHGEPVPMFEAIFVAPLRLESGQWKVDGGGMTVFQPTPEALEVVRAQR